MDEEYDGPERRTIQLRERDLERVAQRAADIIEERGRVAKAAADLTKASLFEEFGRAIAKRVLYVVGTGGGAIGLWEALKALKF